MCRCFSFLWDSVGACREGDGSLIWMEELVWEAWIRCLELSNFVFNVNNLEGTQYRIFEDKASSMDQLKGAFVNALFDWARVSGLTITTLVTEFVDSL